MLGSIRPLTLSHALHRGLNCCPAVRTHVKNESPCDHLHGTVEGQRVKEIEEKEKEKNQVNII